MSNTSEIPYTITSDSVQFVLDGTPHTVKKGTANFEHVKSALLEERWDDARSHSTVAKTVEAWSDGNFKLVGTAIQYRDIALPSELSSRITSMITKGMNTSTFMFI